MVTSLSWKESAEVPLEAEVSAVVTFPKEEVVAQAPSPSAEKEMPAREPAFIKFRLFIRLDFVERYLILAKKEMLVSPLFKKIGLETYC
jgi:hypothetical protein